MFVEMTLGPVAVADRVDAAAATLYVQEKVGTAAAMATVGRVADLETMGREHGLSLNLSNTTTLSLPASTRDFI